MNTDRIIRELKEYDGPEIKIMEVCGTHTSSIFKSGIRQLISPKIKLISGPGCPVCVTPSSYIDFCIAYAAKENHILMTFGDLMKVPGKNGCLSQAKADGAGVEIMYSPLETIEKAKRNPLVTYVIAGVGFETTVPAYALTIDDAIKQGITNIKLLTSLKTVIPALNWICENETGISGFLGPGHVSVIIGSRPYEKLAKTYNIPFAVAGFEPEHILAGIYDIVKQLELKGERDAAVHNLYKNAVREDGNTAAQKIISRFFETGDAMWRGLGIIGDSGLYLKPDFEAFDAGSRGLDDDMELPKACRCGDVIKGRISPDECPSFGKACSPNNPVGPCMVSSEGACGIWYRNV